MLIVEKALLLREYSDMQSAHALTGTVQLALRFGSGLTPKHLLSSTLRESVPATRDMRLVVYAVLRKILDSHCLP